MDMEKDPLVVYNALTGYIHEGSGGTGVVVRKSEALRLQRKHKRDSIITNVVALVLAVLFIAISLWLTFGVFHAQLVICANCR